MGGETDYSRLYEGGVDHPRQYAIRVDVETCSGSWLADPRTYQIQEGLITLMLYAVIQVVIRAVMNIVQQNQSYRDKC